MNKKGQGEEIIVYGFVFLVLFLIGGFIGYLSLPEFSGRFFISGLIIGIFGTGAGAFIIRLIVHR